jgi:hypothetical protein
MQYGPGGIAALLDFKKTVLFDNAFGNLTPSGIFFAPLDCLINFIEKKYLISCIMK